MFESEFYSALLVIITINMILSGDNALVIAIASRKLPAVHRQKAILWGTLLAVVVRVVATVAAAYLLLIPYLYLIGGIILTWIAFNLLIDEEKDGHVKASDNLRAAIQTIVLADIMMGLDNVLAIAGAAKGNLLLIILGLLISIPIMIWGSQIVLKAMERYWWIVYVGSGVLAWTAANMILHEKKLEHFFADPTMGELLKFLLVGAIIGVGLLQRWKIIRYPDDIKCG